MACLKGQCQARAHTVNDEVVHTVNEHTHGADNLRLEAVFAYWAMKEKARATEEPNQSIISTMANETTFDALHYLPSRDTMKRTLRRNRAREQRPHVLPTSLSELTIPAEYAMKNDGTQFLLYDSGLGHTERVIIFGSPAMLSALRSSDFWLADGTFKVAPQLFFQLYPVHCRVNGSVLPAVYALMTHKTTTAYITLLTALKNECGHENQPDVVVLDFEQAAINAFQDVFPNTVVRGCFFHLSQCIYRKVQNVGLQELYAADPDISLKVKMIAALALVPEDDVALAFDALEENIPQNLLRVLDYFEDNFIG
ncbi:uncharacterized protein LOC135378621 [Ornithodoros turicata]|uniref:uncharacterized protein LOC135378621 n=1 Tax=Ornithodoros turicata TaxID=34597 RepID=UPI003139C5CA